MDYFHLLHPGPVQRVKPRHNTAFLSCRPASVNTPTIPFSYPLLQSTYRTPADVDLLWARMSFSFSLAFAVRLMRWTCAYSPRWNICTASSGMQRHQKGPKPHLYGSKHSKVQRVDIANVCLVNAFEYLYMINSLEVMADFTNWKNVDWRHPSESDMLLRRLKVHQARTMVTSINRCSRSKQIGSTSRHSKVYLQRLKMR